MCPSSHPTFNLSVCTPTSCSGLLALCLLGLGNAAQDLPMLKSLGLLQRLHGTQTGCTVFTACTAMPTLPPCNGLRLAQQHGSMQARQSSENARITFCNVRTQWCSHFFFKTSLRSSNRFQPGIKDGRAQSAGGSMPGASEWFPSSLTRPPSAALV